MLMSQLGTALVQGPTVETVEYESKFNHGAVYQIVKE